MSHHGCSTVELVIGGPLRRPDLPGLYARVCTRLEGEAPGLIHCDVSGLTTADAVCLEALARLQLAAGRRGFRIRLRGATGDLGRLLALTGLVEVLPPALPEPPAS